MISVGLWKDNQGAEAEAEAVFFKTKILKIQQAIINILTGMNLLANGKLCKDFETELKKVA